MAQALRRKLTTILSADVAGYSRLMDEDEVATVETLMAYRGAIGGFVERHQGRVVSTAGDGLLADFDSVVEAMPCAAEIQGEPTPATPRLPRRAGWCSGSASTSATSSSRMAIFMARASTSRRGCRAWPSPVVSASRAPCSSRCGTNLASATIFSARRQSRTSASRSPTYRVQLSGDSATAKPREARDEVAAEPKNKGQRTRDQRLVAALVEGLGRPGDRIGALSAITGERFGYDLTAWRAWWAAQDR